MILQLNEIKPGLVAYLEPSILQAFGVDCPHGVRGVHPFVCLEVEGDWCVWAVLSSSSLYGTRDRIESTFKRGETPSWMTRDTFIYGRDYWFCGPTYVFQEASSDSEKSRPHRRNSVTQDGLPFIQERVVYPALQIGGAA